MKKPGLIRFLLVAFLIFSALCFAEKGTCDFSFIHLSDSHISPHYSIPDDFSRLRSYPCIHTMKDLGEVAMPSCKVTAPKPSFFFHTGDITEYGFAGCTWEVTKQYFDGVQVPIYCIPGNHDHTWVADTETFRRLYGGINYSFDYAGCHFLCICSATLQDPVPSMGRELILFVQKDLEKVNPDTPVFIGLHHPMHSKEFCSQYDTDRLMDALRGHNVVLIMDGHGHTVKSYDYWGIDGVQGGSTFSKKSVNDGYNVVAIQNGELFVSYRRYKEKAAKRTLIRKKIPARSSYPEITIHSPKEGDTIKGSDILLKTEIASPPEPIATVGFSLDDELKGEITYGPGKTEHKILAAGLMNGAHFLRVVYKTKGGKNYQKSVMFFLENKEKKMGRARWRYLMKGGSKATPLVKNGTIYVGANDGIFYALNAKSGKPKWTFNAGAEILTTAAQWNDLILFGTGAGKLFALTPDGALKWNFDAGAAIYSSPVVDEKGTVYFGTNQAKIVALDAGTGKRLWENTEPRQSIESTVCVSRERVFAGAWDGYVYCLDAKTGKTIWKQPGPKNQKRVIRYYGPADNGPVEAGGKLFIADRGYMAGRYGMDGKYELTIEGKCSAIGLSEDGKSLYLRNLSDPMKKTDLDGKTLWVSQAKGGRLPVSPLEKNGTVYICSNDGLLQAVCSKSGKTLWEFRISPKLYVMSGVAALDNVVYTTGLDGYVTAVEGR